MTQRDWLELGFIVFGVVVGYHYPIASIVLLLLIILAMADSAGGLRPR